MKRSNFVFLFVTVLAPFFAARVMAAQPADQIESTLLVDVNQVMGRAAPEGKTAMQAWREGSLGGTFRYNTGFTQGPTSAFFKDSRLNTLSLNRNGTVEQASVFLPESQHGDFTVRYAFEDASSLHYQVEYQSHTPPYNSEVSTFTFQKGPDGKMYRVQTNASSLSLDKKNVATSKILDNGDLEVTTGPAGARESQTTYLLHRDFVVDRQNPDSRILGASVDPKGTSMKIWLLDAKYNQVIERQIDLTAPRQWTSDGRVLLTQSNERGSRALSEAESKAAGYVAEVTTYPSAATRRPVQSEFSDADLRLMTR